jgi:hypothetical protein
VIGGLSRLRSLGMVAALAAGLSALPDLGQQRTLSSRPGTGIVARSRPAKRRRDAEREMRAVLKRRRKNALRLRHWQGARDGC